MAGVYSISNAADVRGLLRRALADKRIDGVLGLFWNGSRDMVMPGIVSDPAGIDRLEPLCPVMPVQAARVISNIASTETNRTIACIVKPCEMRAVVELIKLKQILPNKLVFIGVDCGGAMEPLDFKVAVAKGDDPVAGLVSANARFEDFSGRPSNPRIACRICDRCTPECADVRLRSFGESMAIEAVTAKGGQFLDGAGLEQWQGDGAAYDRALDALRAARKAARDAEREAFSRSMGSLEGFASLISTCIRCHNCMVNCPMDYCKECVFRSPVFDHPAESYGLWLDRKGEVRLPTDTMLFHLTRLNHMSTSCVSCGQCETSCPVRIGLTRLFAFTGEETQKIFDYVAGRSLDEELPVAAFREKELSHI